MKILFVELKKETLWEYDFIHNEILFDYENKIDYFLTLDQINELDENFDILVYSCRDQNNYPWGVMPSYDQILRCVKITKPKIIIQLSDEFYFEDLQEHNQLGNYCELFLRQHHFSNYTYTPNTINIPLGYGTGISPPKLIPNMTERYYSWTHVGELKTDRYEMIEHFKNIYPHYQVCGISKSDMIDLYLNSIFVPCGRGNSSLNCFRLYEASMCGAIPIVVGSKEEIDVTFKYENNPPWLFFETWSDALEQCKYLLNNKKELQKIQDEILIWWDNRVSNVRKKVSNIIQSKDKSKYTLNFCILRGRQDLSNKEYIKTCLWEKDFIFNEIFYDYNIKEKIYYIDDPIYEKIDILYFNGREFSYNEIKNYIESSNLRPKIIIFCSDEAGTRDPFISNMMEFNKLSNYCDLLLRQYHHEMYDYDENTFHIPLGYNNNFNLINYNIKKIKDRSYIWSHFSAYWKADRLEIIEKFSNLSPHFYGSSIPVEKVKKYYCDSIFVPCGRGNICLNCFRLYEASMCGAIPIVVGSKEEIDVTFKYENNPPWLFFETWDQAFDECLKLLEDPDKLQKIQDEILIWWDNRVSNVKSIVWNCLDSHKLKNFPPVNFISIESSKDRQELLYKNFQKYQIDNITPHIYKKYDDNDHKIIGSSVDFLAPKEHRGPVTSHLKAIKEWYENTNEEYAFFCEDDLSFDTVKYWNFTWEEFINKLPQNWECVQLSFISTHDYYADRKIIQNKPIFYYRDWCDWSCCAYLIKRSHAKNIVENYFDGDTIILEYKGFDYSTRVETEFQGWLIPTPETMVYTYFIPNTIYTIPLFVEDQRFNSTWTDGVNNKSFHNYSYERVMDWWKTTGKYFNLDNLFSQQ